MDEMDSGLQVRDDQISRGELDVRDEFQEPSHQVFVKDDPLNVSKLVKKNADQEARVEHDLEELGVPPGTERHILLCQDNFQVSKMGAKFLGTFLVVQKRGLSARVGIRELVLEKKPRMLLGGRGIAIRFFKALPEHMVDLGSTCVRFWHREIGTFQNPSPVSRALRGPTKSEGRRVEITLRNTLLFTLLGRTVKI